MNRQDILKEIVNLRYDMDAYREIRQYGKVASIRLEIARLECILRNMKEAVVRA